MDTAQEKISLLGVEVMPEAEKGREAFEAVVKQDVFSNELPCGGFELSFPITVQSLGFQVVWHDEYPVVGTVKRDSEAACHGITTGDIIVETNRTCAKNRSREDLMPTLKARPLLLKFQRTKHDKHDDSEEDVHRDSSRPEDSTDEGTMVFEEDEHDDSSSGEDSTEEIEPARLLQEARSGAARLWGGLLVAKPETGDDMTTCDVAASAVGESAIARADSDTAQDEALARCLQEEYDAVAKAGGANAGSWRQPEDSEDDEALARSLQEEIHAKTFGLRRSPAMREPVKPSTPKNVNLLTTKVQDVHSDKGWTRQLMMMSQQGMTCAKIGRNGKTYRRKFWLKDGALRTNGTFSSSFATSGIESVFMGNVSEDFRQFSIASKFESLPSADRCCVVILEGRSFSLIFDSVAERDLFAETLAFYVLTHAPTSHQQSDDILVLPGLF